MLCPLSVLLAINVSLASTPNNLQASRTGKGSGLGGPSSIQTQNLKRPSKLMFWTTFKVSIPLRILPLPMGKPEEENHVPVRLEEFIAVCARASRHHRQPSRATSPDFFDKCLVSIGLQDKRPPSRKPCCATNLGYNQSLIGTKARHCCCALIKFFKLGRHHLQ